MTKTIEINFCSLDMGSGVCKKSFRWFTTQIKLEEPKWLSGDPETCVHVWSQYGSSQEPK